MTAATITARFNAEGHSAFVSRMKTAQQAVDGVGSAAGRSHGAINQLNSAFSGFGNVPGGRMVGMLGAVAAGLAGVAAFSGFGAAVQMDSLRKGLAAVMGSAAAASDEIKRLEEAAKLPGVDYAESIRTSMALQAVGFSAKTARDLVIEVGNALTLTGGSKALQENVMRQFVQMIGKGKVMEEDLRIISSDMPILRKVMKETFGTADLAIIQATYSADQFITKLLEGMKQMPRAAQGYQNSIDNMADSWFRLRAAIGKPIADAIAPLLDRLSRTFASLSQSKALTAFVERFTVGIPRVLFAMINSLQLIRQLAILTATAFAVMFGVNMISSVVTLVKAFAAIAAYAWSACAALIAGKAAWDPKAIFAFAATLAAVGFGAKQAWGWAQNIGKSQTAQLEMELDKLIGPMVKPQGTMGTMLDMLAGQAIHMIAGRQPPGGGQDNPMMAPMIETARNTGRMANSMDALASEIRTYAIGGGEIMGVAASPVEIAKRRGGGMVRVTGGTEFEQFMASAIQDAIAQLTRQGYLRRTT